MRCVKCGRPITAAAAWVDPVPAGPGRALPGAVGPVCARRAGLAILPTTPQRKRSAGTASARRAKRHDGQTDWIT